MGVELQAPVLLVVLAATAADDPAVTVVTGRAVDPERETAAGTTAFVEVIEVDAQRERDRDLADVLAEAAGVSVRRLGGGDRFTTVSLRGADPNQVVVLFDGVPLNLAASSGGVDLSTFPLAAIERVEVYRGQVPGGLAAPAIGGAVNLVPRRPTERTVTELTLTAASHDTWQASAFTSRPIDDAARWHHLWAATAATTSGDFDFFNDNGTPLVNTGDDRVERRRNNDARTGHLLGRLSRDGDRLHLAFTAEAFGRAQGLPNIANNQALHAGLRTARGAVHGRARGRDVLAHGIDLTAEVWGRYFWTELADPRGEIALGQGPRSHDVVRDLGGTMAGTLRGVTGPLGQVVLARLSAWGQRYRQKRFLDGGGAEVGPEAQRVALEVALQDELLLFDGELRFVPALTLTHVWDDFPGGAFRLLFARSPARQRRAWLATPRAGIAWEVAPGLRLQANVGHYVRDPAIPELFGDRGAAVGNPALKPEASLNFDAGALWDFAPEASVGGVLDAARVAVAFFGRRARDLIVAEALSQNRFENVEAARVFGVEASAHVRLAGHAAAWVTWTWQDARNRGDAPFHRGRRLPLVAAHEVGAGAETWWHLSAVGLRAFATFAYASGNYLNAANQPAYARFCGENRGAPLPARVVGGAGLTVFPDGGPRVTGEVRNAGDACLAWYDGFPLPGRTFALTVAWQW
jgi:iron complex outermembrane receptor protein